MKKITVLLLLLFAIHSTRAQEKNLPLDSTYFLLGTLKDYMGRSKSKTDNENLDRYSKHEKDLVFTLFSMFNASYPDLRISSSKDSLNFNLYSKVLTKEMDEFYEYTPTSRSNQQRDTIYMGMLRKEMYQTDLQRLSFIAGVYARFGVANDSAYCIKLFNSMSKAKVCEEILTDLKCSGVKYHTNKGYIPKSHFIYFTPNAEVMRYLEAYMPLRNKIEAGYQMLIKEVLPRSSSSQ